MNSFTIIISLINNAALLLALGLIYDTLVLNRKHANSVIYDLITGAILGAIGIAVMANPCRFTDGIIFDTRSVLLSISGLFFGLAPTSVAMLMTAGYRLYLGGNGATMGVSVILCSGIIGVLWKHFRRKPLDDMSFQELYGFSFIVHIAMILCMNLLPQNVVRQTVIQIGLPVMLVYPVGAALLGKLISDRHARKKDQVAMQRSEVRFRTYFENSILPMAIAAPGKQWLEVNDSLCSLLGYSHAELERMTWLELTHPEDVAADVAQFNRVEAGEIDGYSLEKRFIKKNRDSVDTILTVRMVRNFDRQPEYYLAQIQDITERKKTESERLNLTREMLHAQKMESLGILAGGIAHDFNNLLTAILGHTSLAMMDAPANSPMKESLAEIETATKRAAELAQQMLAYSGKGMFHVSSINLNRMVEEMRHLLSASISKKITMRLELAASTPLIEGDATQIRQVLMNLIVNAAEAIDDKEGEIFIRTGTQACSVSFLEQSNVAYRLNEDAPSAAGEFAFLEVQDTGCGMDAATKSHIFDPFFTTKFTGRGLGLAAIQGIIKGHRGILTLDSEAGKGSVFRVLFPMHFSTADSPDEPHCHLDTAEWNADGRILLVDDEDDVRNTAKRMLEKLGFDVITARNGREAVDLFSSQMDSIRCILLDMTMPVWDGERTLHELKKIKPDIKIVLNSGYTEHNTAQLFVDQGQAHFIKKPYSLEELKQTLKQVFNEDNRPAKIPRIS